MTEFTNRRKHWLFVQNKKLFHLKTLSTTKDMWALSPQGWYIFQSTHCLLLPLQPWKVEQLNLSGLTTFLSLSFFYRFLPITISGKMRGPEFRADGSITLFSVNYFISLGFLVEHFKWCVSYQVFYKQSPTLFSRDNRSKMKLCDFQLSDKVFVFLLFHFAGTFTIKAVILGLRQGHFLLHPVLIL